MNLKLIITLSRVAQALHKKLGKIFNEEGLTTSQFAVLEVLYHKGELTINEIIGSVLLTSGNMTVVINNLEKDSWIVRHINPTDKRSCFLPITEKRRKQIEIKYVMGGLVKDIRDFYDSYNDIGKDPEQSNKQVVKHWLEASQRHGMPVESEGFHMFSDEYPSTYPQNIAYKAAQMENQILADKF